MDDEVGKPSVYILTGGSRGDSQPAVALGQGLLEAGYSIVLAGGRENAEFAAACGFSWIELSSFRQSMESEAVRQAFQSGDTDQLFAALESINADNGPTDVRKFVSVMEQDDHIAAVVTMTQHCALASFLGQRFHVLAITLMPAPSYPTGAYPPALVDSSVTALEQSQWAQEQQRLLEMIASACAQPLSAKVAAAGCPEMSAAECEAQP